KSSHSSAVMRSRPSVANNIEDCAKASDCVISKRHNLLVKENDRSQKDDDNEVSDQHGMKHSVPDGGQPEQTQKGKTASLARRRLIPILKTRSRQTIHSRKIRKEVVCM